MKQYLLALDEGTTSARAILFDRQARVVAMAQREFPQSYPRPGWVEQDPMEIYASQYAVLTEVVAKSGISAQEIAAIGMTNQRETTIVWERGSGKPVAPAIVWQCRRTAPYCEQLTREGHGDIIRSKTGLPIDAYFSATKIKWILDNTPGARERAARGELLFGTVDCWLLWKLSGGRVHATDRTNASRTMLYNIHTLDWDEELLALFDIPRAMLPQVLESSTHFATVSLLGAEIPVRGIAGDQQAALFGQCCFAPGEVKNTYGTGCFLLMNTGTTPVESRYGLITTIAASAAGSPPTYALEGSVFTGGSVIQWLRDGLGILHEARDSEYFAAKLADNGGVYFVPSFTGLGAPYWDMYARGTISGLSRGTGRSHIIRAALEAIAYQTEDVLHAMECDTGSPITTLQADGGASSNGLLMQFQADISAVCVRRPACGEATAKGAAYLAGLASGFFESGEALRALAADEALFTPQMEQEKRTQYLDGWHAAVARARSGQI